MTQPVLTDAEMHALISGNPFALGLSIARLKDFIRQVEKAVVAKLVAEQKPVMYARTYNGEIDWDEHCVAADSGTLFDCGSYHDENDKIPEGYAVMPLYAYPMPSASPERHKHDCVSKSGESDTQQHLECIKRYQKWRRGESKTMDEADIYPKQIGESLDWLITLAENHIEEALELARNQPCGCIVCYCENQERCLGCGAKYCGTHEVGEIPNPVYVDHIAGVSNMVDADHIPDIGQMITPLAQRKIQSLLDKGEYRVIENASVLVNNRGHAAIVNHGGAFYWVDNEALAREFDGVGVGADSDHIAGMRKKVPEGWQLIPKEPTEKMRIKGGSAAAQSSGTWGCAAIEAYKAMLAAAPKYTGDSNE